jgi:hypothetical protein
LSTVLRPLRRFDIAEQRLGIAACVVSAVIDWHIRTTRLYLAARRWRDGAGKTWRVVSLSMWILLVQREIELEDVHVRLAEEAEVAAFGVLRDQLPRLIR